MKKSTFDTMVEHYKTKYLSTKKTLSSVSMNSYCVRFGYSEEKLKTGLANNDEEFRKFVLAIAHSLMPGRVSCTTYAAVLGYIAEHIGVEYEVYSGFCLPTNSDKYEQTLSEFNAKREAGEEHPLFASHVYVTINDEIYEYFNGETSNIDHIDCVRIF